MNVLTVLEQPVLSVELRATLELAADFANASKARATQAAYGSDCRSWRSSPSTSRPTIDAVVHLGAQGGVDLGTRPNDHCWRLVANDETHSSTFWK